MNRISRFAMALLVAGGLGVAGFGMAAGTARAGPGGWPVATTRADRVTGARAMRHRIPAITSPTQWFGTGTSATPTGTCIRARAMSRT